MQKIPLVSVISPVYNVERYIMRCVESVLAQTYDNMELILVDDGSKDLSLSLCKEIAKKDDRVRVYSKKNGGVSSARSFGLSKAQGDFLTFVDSDDWIESGYIEDLALPMIRDRKIDISLGLFIRDGADGRQRHYFCVKSPHYIEKRDAWIQLMDIEYWGSGSQSKMYRGSLMEGFQFNRDLIFGEDLADCWTLFGRARKIYYTGSEKYHYTENPDSISHVAPPERIADFLLWLLRKRECPEARDDIRLRKTVGARILALYHETVSGWFFDDLPKKNKLIRDFHNRMKENIAEILGDFSEQPLFERIYGRYAREDDLACDYQRMIDEIEASSGGGKRLYIYGAGELGKKVSSFFTAHRIDFEGFIVSGKGGSLYEGKEIYPLDEIVTQPAEEVSVILGMSDKNIGEVYEKIGEIPFHHLFIW